MSGTPYEQLAGLVKARGEPYGGATLRHHARDVQVACSACGKLPAPGLHGWATDWLTLCQEVRAHALREGHEIAVSLWLGAVYGPVAPEDEV